MKWEYKVFFKLFKYYLRVFWVFYLCEDEFIIGVCFVVLERRLGVVVRIKVIFEFYFFEKIEERLVMVMMKVMVELYLIDYEVVDLVNLGWLEGFVER